MLTLLDVRVGRQMTERAVRPALIVIEPTGFDVHPGVVHGHELVHVQTLVAEPPVERFNEGVFGRLSRPRGIELDAPIEGPVLERP